MEVSSINLACLLFKKNYPIKGSCNYISDNQIYITLVSVDVDPIASLLIDDQILFEIPHLIVQDAVTNNLGADLYFINKINALNFDNFLTDKIKPGILPISASFLSAPITYLDPDSKIVTYAYDIATGNLNILVGSDSSIKADFIYVNLMDFGEFTFKNAFMVSKYFTGYFPLFEISTGGLYTTNIMINIEGINIMSPLKQDCSEDLKVSIFYTTPSGASFHEITLSGIPFQSIF